jgi:hypothetical protein
VFLVIINLGVSHFDEQLIEKIDSHRNFLVTLPPGSPENCKDPTDGFQRKLRMPWSGASELFRLQLKNFHSRHRMTSPAA